VRRAFWFQPWIQGDGRESVGPSWMALIAALPCDNLTIALGLLCSRLASVKPRGPLPSIISKNLGRTYPMDYSQSPPLAEALDLGAMSDQRIGKRPVSPSIHSAASSSLKDDQVASDRSSVGRRIFRTLARFFIAVFIGVGGTLAWQSHGDSAKEMVIARVPALAWLLSVSTTKSPAVTATSPDPMQQLEPLASNLDVVRRNVEELATKQDQMAQNIATLQAVEEDIRQKISSTPRSPSQQAAPIPQRKPPQPRTKP